MKFRFLLILGVIFSPLFSAFRIKSCVGDEIVFKNPVADLTSRAPSDYGILGTYIKTYSPEPNGCIRCFQALFNERGTVLQEKGDYVRVGFSHCFYVDSEAGFNSEKGGIFESVYWAKRSDIITLAELKSCGFDTLIPEPISYKNPSSVAMDGVVTLRAPWKDKATGQVFSAGTRFVSLPSERCGKGRIPVKILTFKDEKIGKRLCSIPVKVCQRSTMLRNEIEIRDTFVGLLNEWCEKSLCSIIPYVWGGGSYTGRVPRNGFVKKIVFNKDGDKEIKIGYWDRPCVCGDPTGFDCSMLILRAAQICKIPYFCRTSATVAAVLQPLKKDERAQPGDIIWVEGHVLVLVDDNSVIAAERYASGFGAVLKTPIARRFGGIKTYKDLEKLYFEKKPLDLLTVDEQPFVSKEFKIFKLPV